MTTGKRRLTFDAPRELLLLEIARRCHACDAPARVGLTKQEARDYTGFECEACGEWNDDELTERDVPEWWEELRVTNLEGLRAAVADNRPFADDEEPDPVKRLSEAWRAEARDDEGPAGSGESPSGDDDPAGGGSAEGSF